MMSLILVEKSHAQKYKSANDLGLGTWFMDDKDQIYVIALDDRTNEKRILCAGNFYKPFLVNVPLTQVDVQDVLEVGTVLKITSVTNYGDEHGK